MNLNEEKIPFHRPMQLAAEELGVIFDEKMSKMFESGQLTNGANCRELEQWFQDYYHCKHAIATCNATQGLLITLHALHREKAVWHTPAFAWFSTPWAIDCARHTAVYEDIDPETWLMQEGPYNYALPVHTFGNTQAVQADRVVYDGAHALGSKLPDIGDATVFSLAPTKIITSIEGGVVITDNDILAANIRALRDKTCRLSEIHAIFGTAYLKHLKDVMIWKLKCNTQYRAANLGKLQVCAYDYNMNTIGIIPHKDLKIPASIETRKYYVPLVHGLKNTDYVYNHIICLPSWYQCPIDEVIRRIKLANE